MGASDDFQDSSVEFYQPRADGLVVNTIPSMEPPASADPHDPRALLATAVERIHALVHAQSTTTATLENIRARVERLNNQSNSLHGTDSDLARRLAENVRLAKETQAHVEALENGRSFLMGVCAAIGAVSSIVIGLLTWGVSHVHFS